MDRQPDDEQWRELRTQCELVQAAARLAWEALIEAYTDPSDGFREPPVELLARYRQARLLRMAAEQALLDHLESRPQ